MEKTLKDACKATTVIVREMVDADQVLPPSGGSGTAALTLRGDGVCVDLASASPHDAAVVRVVREGWGRAQAGLAEIVRFGAMLLAVQDRLDDLDNLQQRLSSSGHGGDRRSGTGLKGWLAKNCPEVNYNTAYGYMMAASGLRREARLADDVPLLALMGEDPVPEAKAEKLRARIYKVIADSSLSLLREAARAPDVLAAKGGDRRSGLRMTEEEKHLKAVDDARQIWLAHTDALVDNARRLKTHLFLDAATLDAVLIKLDAVRDELKDARRVRE